MPEAARGAAAIPRPGYLSGRVKREIVRRRFCSRRLRGFDYWDWKRHVGAAFTTPRGRSASMITPVAECYPDF